jgi:hypothetical protein
MQQLRLLASSLVASAFALQAAAQSPAVSLTQTPNSPAITITTPRTFTTNSLPSTFSATFPQAAQSNLFHFDTSKDSSTLALHADAGTQLLDTQAQSKALAQLKLKEREITVAQTHPPCYTMRVYGFTTQDLKSSHPHASSESDCTPASSAKLKAIQIPGTMSVEIPATK